MSNEGTWSPDEALGTETYRQGDAATDESERLDPRFREELESDPSIDPALAVDEVELDELGARFDDPELMVVMEGGMDDPDGADVVRAQRREEEEGWRLDAPLLSESPDRDDDAPLEPEGLD